MKVYVFGITIDREIYKNETSTKLCQRLVESIPEIMKNAKDEMGKDVIVLITLYEYGLTNKAITKGEKDSLLQQLMEATKDVENLILSPGTIPYHHVLEIPLSSSETTDEEKSTDNHEEVEDKINRRDKIKNNYKYLSTFFPTSRIDAQFIQEWTHLETVILNPENEITYCVNPGYLIIDGLKYKHKKFHPHHERDRVLSDEMAKQSIFYPGWGTTIETLSLKEEKVTLKLVVCREYFHIEMNELAKQELVDICVLLSNSIDMPYLSAFEAALNVWFDEKNGLSVFFNPDHENACRITECKVAHVQLGKNGNTFHCLASSRQELINNPVQIFMAAREDNVEKLQELLDRGLAVNSEKKPFTSPLSCVIYYECSREMLSALLNNGANPYALLSGIAQQFHFVEHLKTYPHKDLICSALNIHKSFIKAPCNKVNTPLHVAVQFGYGHIVVEFLNRKVLVEVKNSHGWTPLQLAMIHGHVTIFELLLRHSNLLVTNKLDNNLLHIAAFYNRADIMRLILTQSSTSNMQKLLLLHSTNIAGDTPLHIAAFNGSFEAAQCLLENGAKLDAMNEQDETPPMVAQKRSHLHLLRLFKEEQSNLEITSPVTESHHNHQFG